MIAPIGLTHHRGDLQITRTAPQVRLDISHPSVRIAVQVPQVAWDRSDYRDAVNVLLPSELGASLFADAQAAVAGAITDIAAQGDALSRIERGNTIATVALASQPQDERELTLEPVPPPVRTDRSPGSVDIDVSPGAIRANPDLTPLEVNATDARVTVDTEVPTEVNVQV